MTPHHPMTAVEYQRMVAGEMPEAVLQSRVEFGAFTGQGSRAGHRTELLWSNRDLHHQHVLDLGEAS